MDEGLKQCVI